MKPKVFIGSSREGLPIANAIHTNLTRQAECTVWANGVFQLSANTLSDLIRVLRDSDFGIFIFSPDDLTIMRDALNSAVRDNVIFELGLFIGRLGAERCFFLVPEDSADLRLPSDLAGITPGVYESGRSDGNWMAALNPACMQITLQMDKLKTFQDVIVGTAGFGSGAADLGKRKGVKLEKKKDINPSLKSTSSGKAGTGDNDGSSITAEKYKQAYLIKGDTKPIKEKLKELGARWNQGLGGWIIPAGKLDEFTTAIPRIKVVDES